MINKIVTTLEEAVSDIRDGSVVAVGGFGYAGTPFNLLKALAAVEPKPKDLTVIGTATRQVDYLVAGGGVKKVICPYPSFPGNIRAFRSKCPVVQAYKRGEVEVEVIPLGTLVEKLRAAGAGIPAFYCPVGVGTIFGEGKEVCTFDGVECILERALKVDYALIKGHKGDRYGNLVYRGTTRQTNPIMAMAADCTIAEVDEIVEVGELDIEAIVTPGIFVHRVVKAPKTDPYGYYQDFFSEEMAGFLKYVKGRTSKR